MKLSEKLRNLRITRGETQEQVAKELQIGIQTLRNYENDKLDRIPNPYQLKKLKDKYDVTYEYLLDDDCENKEHETFDIGKKLKLSDKAIQNIMDLQRLRLAKFAITKESFLYENVISPSTFNFFIENFESLKEFTFLLNELVGLIRIYNNLDYFLRIFDLQFYIIDCLSKDRENLKKLFAILETKMNDIFRIAQNADNCIEIDTEYFSDIKEYCEELKEYCKEYDSSSKLNLIKKNQVLTDSELYDLLNEILELSITSKRLIYKEISYTKYELSKMFTDFFDSLGGKDLDYNSEFPEELINFKKANNVIKERIELEVKEESNNKEGVKNGSTRNNKK